MRSALPIRHPPGRAASRRLWRGGGAAGPRGNRLGETGCARPVPAR